MSDLYPAVHAASAFVDDVAAVERFGGGHIHDTYLVESSEGEIVLQRLNTAVFSDPDAVMGNIDVVHRHLRGELVPEPVMTRDGGPLLRDGAGVWRGWRRVPDAAPVATSSLHSARAAGELLGAFHTRLHDLDPDTVRAILPGFHDPRRRLDALRAAIRADVHDRATAAHAEIEACLARAGLADRAEEVHATVPRRVAHNDAKLDNMLFRDGTAVCLVDLDTIMPGAWLWDVGDLVRTASTRAGEDDPAATVDPTLYSAVLDGYRRAAGDALAPSELGAVEVSGPIVAWEQAVRFLTDWLDGDTYYRTSRAGQNLDRARAQLGLLASMPDTVPHS